MTRHHHNHQIPEPSLPETELIRNSAPMPELSAGFRARVMAECSVSIASAARIRRWKIGGTVAAVCTAGLLICLAIPDSTQTHPVLVEQPEQIQKRSSESPMYVSPAYTDSGTHSAVTGKNVPNRLRDSDGGQMNEVIESLNGRKKVFNSDMLPHF